MFSSVSEYARRAKLMKPLFLNNGFRLVYDNDLGEPLADGLVVRDVRLELRVGNEVQFLGAHPLAETGDELALSRSDDKRAGIGLVQ